MPRYNTQEEEQRDQISSNNHFNLVDLLLLDHSYLKECIDVFNDKDINKKTKLSYTKSFLDALKKHSAGEQKALYAPLKEVTELRSMVLKAEAESAIADSKIKALTAKIASAPTWSEELEAEIKVLSEIVEHHVKEEETELFPKMQKKINKILLNEMGFQFMVIRQFSERDLQNNPELKEEVSFIKKSHPIPISNFLNRTHEYFSTQSSHR